MWITAAMTIAAAADPCSQDLLVEELTGASDLLANLVGSERTFADAHLRVRKALACLNEPLLPTPCRDFYTAEAYAVRDQSDSSAGPDAMISRHLCGGAGALPTPWARDGQVVTWNDEATGATLDWDRALPRPRKGTELWVDGRPSHFAPSSRSFVLQFSDDDQVQTKLVIAGADLPTYRRRSRLPVWTGLGLGAVGAAGLIASIPIDAAVERCLADAACSSDRARSLTQSQATVFWGGLGAAATGALLVGGWELLAPKRRRPTLEQ